MRRAHNTPISVKAGNLARWFPPWTVTREQWHSMSRPSVSGIAIDTFLFSRIGMPLFHRYRVFDCLGGHPAFRGPYMSRLFAFLKEADAESIRRSHRRRAKEIAASMSKRTSSIKEVPAATSSSRRLVQCTPVSKITGRESGPSLIPTAGSRPQLLASSIYRLSAEKDTEQALMDLSLPRFTKLDDGVIPKTKPWPVTENPRHLRRRRKTETEHERRHHVWIWMTFPRIARSETCHHRRRIRSKRDPRSVSQPGPTDGLASEPTPEPTPTERPVEMKTDSLIDKPPAAELPEWSDTEVMPLIIIENSSVEK